jgi:hypothetical protein
MSASISVALIIPDAEQPEAFRMAAMFENTLLRLGFHPVFQPARLWISACLTGYEDKVAA